MMCTPGTLSPEWSQWQGPLTFLNLSHNAINSTLPAAWGQGQAWPSLETLDLSYLGLQGPIPVQVRPGKTKRAHLTFSKAEQLMCAPVCSGPAPPGWRIFRRFTCRASESSSDS